MQDLQTASSSFMQKVYQTADAPNAEQASQASAGDANSQAKGETIDAEFNENDDQDKK